MNEGSEPAHPDLNPEPCALSPEVSPALALEPWMRPIPPREPLVLTPEEKARFERLESRYSHDPKLAEHVRETYRQLREERLAREALEKQSQAV